MGRARKALRMQEVGAQWLCYMRHPISRRIRYVPLGSGAHTAEKKLEHLNAVFLSSDLWHDVPNDFPPDLREIWIGEENKVSTDGKTVKQGKTESPGRCRRTCRSARRSHVLQAAIRKCLGKDPRTRERDRALARSSSEDRRHLEDT
jgi:hypothetical protein